MIYNNNLPTFIQISHDITKNILTGVLQKDSKLESVRSLAVKYKVTTKTMQNTLNHLEEKNIIRKVQGSGIFVNVNKDELKLHLRNEALILTKEYLDNLNNLGYKEEDIKDLVKETNYDKNK